MQLTELLACGVSIDVKQAVDQTINITGLSEDSRTVAPGYLFAAIKGKNVNGVDYIDNAIQNGASVILVTPDIAVKNDHVTILHHENPRKALGYLAARFFTPQPKHIVAVTGTNGKTSTVDFCRQLWAGLGKKAASIGTLGIFIDKNTRIKAGALTTPDIVSLHKTLQELATQNIDYVAMEASSHGLIQDRLSGVNIEAAAFTNISRDHLDYHSDFDDYFNAKMQLLENVLPHDNTAIINADIPENELIESRCKNAGVKTRSYGKKSNYINVLSIESKSDCQAVELNVNGKKYGFSLPLMGAFQVENFLCALALILEVTEHVTIENIIDLAETLIPVSGRMEMIAKHPNGAAILIDYAHTPDALQKLLTALKNHLSKVGKLHVVFGCGGDRDSGKRPQMGQIADQFADSIVITDDNPRHEEPKDIRKEILMACPRAIEIGDRKKAIEYAIEHLQSDDILVIAGKGHEKVQIIGDESVPFDDIEVAQQLLKAS